MSRHTPRVITCMLLMAVMDALPRVIGLRRTFALLRRIAPRRGVSTDFALVAETARRVAIAGAFYPRRALCLEQSLTLFVLLRRRGIAADLRLGVQPRPFYAHAWVEVDGRPINESSDLPLTLAAFPSLGV